MKFGVFKILGTSALALSMSLLPAALPAAAQTDTNTTDTNSVTTPGERANYGDTTDQGDRDFDWGWLGLLGLLGLAGLAKKNDEPVAYREPDVVSRSSGYRE